MGSVGGSTTARHFTSHGSTQFACCWTCPVQQLVQQSTPSRAVSIHNPEALTSSGTRSSSRLGRSRALAWAQPPPTGPAACGCATEVRRRQVGVRQWLACADIMAGCARHVGAAADQVGCPESLGGGCKDTWIAAMALPNPPGVHQVGVACQSHRLFNASGGVVGLAAVRHLSRQLDSPLGAAWRGRRSLGLVRLSVSFQHA